MRPTARDPRRRRDLVSMAMLLRSSLAIALVLALAPEIGATAAVHPDAPASRTAMDCLAAGRTGSLPVDLPLCMAGFSPTGGVEPDVRDELDVPSPHREASAETRRRVAPVCAPVPVVDDRCESWIHANDGSGDGRPGSAIASAVAPDGKLVFVTGSQQAEDGRGEVLTTAILSETGQRVWSHTISGEPGLDDIGLAVATNADGSRVFITGYANSDYMSAAWLTAAYDAATGDPLWSVTDQAEAGFSQPTSIVVSPDASTVYVTGGLFHPEFVDADYMTKAYDAATGELRWADRYAGGSGDVARGMRLAPDGSRLYVTGTSFRDTGLDAVTLAYETGDSERLGERVWDSVFDGGSGTDSGQALDISPDGGTAFVGVWSQRPGQSMIRMRSQFAAVALDTSTGEQRWVSTFKGPAEGLNAPSAVAVSPDGQRVFVTGMSSGLVDELDLDYGTVAFLASSGQKLWSAQNGLPGQITEAATALDVSPDGNRVYVTGYSTNLGYFGFAGGVGGGGVTLGGGDRSHIATLAYDASDGTTEWTARLNNVEPGIDTDFGWSVVADPLGERVFVTGTFNYRVGGDFDAGTAAYAA